MAFSNAVNTICTMTKSYNQQRRKMKARNGTITCTA